ncbi:glycosyltransferase [Sulfitobacter delicatus]|uniref:Predicted glycosyl transferase n=1 Tax=Sulfitobacter delicatus TaxID=218672 RepID=A0A1G7U4M6_9RHOB|nr:glycosyltransferase [Sulfitobacter delicatus]SDG42354.1 Predicted glycosyl transferase [Sulfitobacter delicatus]
MTRPIGYFVHHQGRGHAERCAAVVNALPESQSVTVFCAKPDIFPAFTRPVEMISLPSLFEPSGQEDIHDKTTAPDTVHCAPLGWPGIRQAMAQLAGWFASANPVLMISDVSAEVAQLARLCSVPHVKVLQHGLRDDPGHRAAYDGAVGLLCPGAEALAQPDWPERHLAKSHFAGGLGVDVQRPDPARRAAARSALGVSPDQRLVVVMSGGGGTGFASAPFGISARAMPETAFITIGQTARDWHATEPANLQHHGWVDNAADYLAAADMVVASTGNTTCHQILAAETPWLAVPEWRYFDEQVEKAKALARAGAAHHLPHFPASAGQWKTAIQQTLETHDPARQRALVDENAAAGTARWLTGLSDSLLPETSNNSGDLHDVVHPIRA